MYGISSFCLSSEPLASALDTLVALTDRIEIMDEGLHHLDSAEILHSFDCRFSFHAPSRGTNLASLLEPIRKASVEVMAQCMAVAGDVEGSVVLHPGYFAWPVERTKAEQQLARSLAELSHISNDNDVPFFVENMGNWEYFLFKTPEEFPLIGSARFALDVGHAHQMHCLDAFLPLPASHYHLHDNAGEVDSHLAVGEGTIDFSRVMKVVRASGIDPIIEVKSLEAATLSIERLDAIR
jgi:sugar phosphate isomerase/epimerase